jgi:hypothetical protein
VTATNKPTPIRGRSHRRLLLEDWDRLGDCGRLSMAGGKWFNGSRVTWSNKSDRVRFISAQVSTVAVAALSSARLDLHLSEAIAASIGRRLWLSFPRPRVAKGFCYFHRLPKLPALLSKTFLRHGGVIEPCRRTEGNVSRDFECPRRSRDAL